MADSSSLNQTNTHRDLELTNDVVMDAINIVTQGNEEVDPNSTS